LIRQDNIQEIPPYSAAFSRGLKVNKYALLAHIYFFFNAVLLPRGLLFTYLLSPVFFYNLLKRKRKTYVVYFGAFLFVYDVIHLYGGVDPSTFLASNVLFILTYLCVISFYYFISSYGHLARLFRQILLFNALMAAIAIPFFFLPKPYQAWFWYFNKLTAGVNDFPRLALLTYEASYYSLLMIPVFYYYLLKFFFNSIENNKWLTLALISVPMLMSLSFGVLGVTAVTAVIMGIAFGRKLFKRKRTFVIIFSVIISALAILVFLLLFFPQNALFIRFSNVLAGIDTSANGRTIDSFSMAWRLADIKNIFFGIGLGQIKIMVVEVARTYYRYWGIFERYDIPNAMGETLAIFGLTGVALRLFLEGYLFLRQRFIQTITGWPCLSLYLSTSLRAAILPILLSM